MFLSKKSFIKIMILTIVYILLGNILFALGRGLRMIGADAMPLFLLGLLCYFLCPVFAHLGRRAEGRDKFILLGNKLLQKELKPAAFLAEYEKRRGAKDLVIASPQFEVLQFVALSHYLLGDREKTLATAEEMIAVAKKKRMAQAKLCLVSYLFCFGICEQAQALFHALQAQKLDFLSQMLADTILKSDRAMAMGDYQTVVRYHETLLAKKSFPKPTRLSLLASHAQLAEAYEKMGEQDSARAHYRYCAENGGETVFTQRATAALARLFCDDSASL